MSSLIYDIFRSKFLIKIAFLHPVSAQVAKSGVLPKSITAEGSFVLSELTTRTLLTRMIVRTMQQLDNNLTTSKKWRTVWKEVMANGKKGVYFTSSLFIYYQPFRFAFCQLCNSSVDLSDKLKPVEVFFSSFHFSSSCFDSQEDHFQQTFFFQKLFFVWISKDKEVLLLYTCLRKTWKDFE